MKIGLLSWNRRDVVAVEVVPFLVSEVAGHATARQRHQQLNVHGIDLDDCVVSGGKKARLQSLDPSHASHPAAVSREGGTQMHEILIRMRAAGDRDKREQWVVELL